MKPQLTLIFGLSAIWLTTPCFAPGYAPSDTESLKWLPEAAAGVAILSVVAVILAVRASDNVSVASLGNLLLKSILVLALAEIGYWTISYFVTADDPKQMVIRQIFGMGLSVPVLIAALAISLRFSSSGQRWPLTKCVLFIAGLFVIWLVSDAMLLLLRIPLRTSIYYYAIDCLRFGALAFALTGSLAAASLAVRKNGVSR